MKEIKLMREIINRLEIGTGLIILHHNADIDALGSAIAFKYAFPDFDIGAFQNISQLGKKFLTNFEDISIISEPEIEKYQTIIILDTSTSAQLGLNQELPAEYIVIDHHARSENWNTELYYCDDSKSSCAEIVFELLELAKISFTKKMTLALLAAIIADTGHFKYATLETFSTFTKLLVLVDLKPGEVFEVLENSNEIDHSRRIAHLKGAQRLKFKQVKNYLLATSILSSYEASMCKNLMQLGADIAFVGAQRGDQIRISSRATRDLTNKGIHLGEFLKEVGDELHAEGGGHDGAAGLNGVGDIEMALNLCVNKISEKLIKM